MEFVRLTEVPLAEVVALLNNRRTHRHLPLAGEFSEQASADWVRDKDAQWEVHGYGAWAIMVDGRFAGWGGFQHEDLGADLALVLDPEYWGLGARITQEFLQRGFSELGIDEVTIALPYTRNPEAVLARWGFVPDGEVRHSSISFQLYRPTHDAWVRRRGSSR